MCVRCAALTRTQLILPQDVQQDQSQNCQLCIAAVTVGEGFLIGSGEVQDLVSDHLSHEACNHKRRSLTSNCLCGQTDHTKLQMLKLAVFADADQGHDQQLVQQICS